MPHDDDTEVVSSVPVLAPPDAENLRICREAVEAGVETIIARVREATLAHLAARGS